MQVTVDTDDEALIERLERAAISVLHTSLEVHILTQSRRENIAGQLVRHWQKEMEQHAEWRAEMDAL